MLKVTQDRLQQVLRYNSETGAFTWRSGVNVKLKDGTPAGCKDSRGHLQIGIDGRYYGAHRLAWLYVHGRWPANDIDHINGCKTDNRMSNLREATRAQNVRNTGLRRGNNSGFKGVSRLRGKWQAKIGVNYKQIYLGVFDDPEKAAAAYREAAAKYHGEFARI